MRAAQKKAAERTDLKTVKTITVTLTIEASEENFQRLAALMLLQDPTKAPLPELAEIAKMPWEVQPQPAGPPLELDYNVIRNEIMAVLPKYVEKFGQDGAKGLLEVYGGKTLKTVPDDNLWDLLTQMQIACEL